MADADVPLPLDTHAFVWAMTAPERRAAPARAAIEQHGRVVLLSTASIWEIAIKVGRGRWTEPTALLDDFDTALRRAGIAPLPIGSAHPKRAGLLAWDHRDPFDRVLAAQAIAEDAHLVTLDPAFSTVPEQTGFRRIWNQV